MDQIEVFLCVTTYFLECGYQLFGRTSYPAFSVGVNTVMWPNYTTVILWINKLEDGGLCRPWPSMVTASVDWASVGISNIMLPEVRTARNQVQLNWFRRLIKPGCSICISIRLRTPQRLNLGSFSGRGRGLGFSKAFRTTVGPATFA
jgi:hypothetical protein